MSHNIYTLWVGGQVAGQGRCLGSIFNLLFEKMTRFEPSLTHPTSFPDILYWMVLDDVEYVVTLHIFGDIELTQVEELDGEGMPTGRTIPAYDTIGWGSIKVSHTAGQGYNYQIVS